MWFFSSFGSVPKPTNLPLWWATKKLSQRSLIAHPATNHHMVGDEVCQKMLWRYIDAMQPKYREWLFNPDNVTCERKHSIGTKTLVHVYWCHEWTFYRRSNGRQLARVYATSFDQCAGSVIVIEDGTNNFLDPEDTTKIARSWEMAMTLGT